MNLVPWSDTIPIDRFGDEVARHVVDGARLAGLFASVAGPDTRLIALLSHSGSLIIRETEVPASADGFPTLSNQVPAAAWYEREIHDLFGLIPRGLTRLDPLVFPFSATALRPRLGSGTVVPEGQLDPSPLPAHLGGEGVFTISYGPVRSGVFESIEYLVETPGEDIPHLRTRVFYKHRGVETRFEALDVQDGVLLAERCEGVASVAHAIAYCSAIEDIAGVEVSFQAGLVRVLHAELERIANHLDSIVRHCEASGQAVAFARFTLHKERVQRLRAQLCGSRFGRGVVVPGGVSGGLGLGAAETLAAIDYLEQSIDVDTRLLMSTPSFLDRLRGTGVLTSDLARRFGALGPVARGSGLMEDTRFDRTYGAYVHLGQQLLEIRPDGDALARQRVRTQEITGAFSLLREVIEELNTRAELSDHEWRRRVGTVSGRAVGWAEAPQGEVLYLIEVHDGQLVRVKPRSASFHNMALFPIAFPKDILTDFAFIEASFGLSIAGVSN